ncbi:MAG TPA: ATP-dependent DNA helicase [Candidatus Thermoplasmatota archaeon]|nr:ATP-dependent DNA helicase [Candidatus Thermoplasmatota archaeon]
MDLLPYAPRPHQRELVGFLQGVLSEGGHGVVESGTGTGKTVSALASALAAALPRGKRVLYLTRTNSQGKQVVVEARAIAPRLGSPLLVVALQGRQNLCPQTKEDPEFAEANSEELALMCRDACKAVEEEIKGNKPRVKPCPFFRRSLGDAAGAVEAWVRAEPRTAEELIAHCGSAGLCPYEITRRLLPEARVVVAPYVYLFNPFLRRAFLSWTGAILDDFVVVVDEAHNLPGYARELLSAELGSRSLDKAHAEALELGDPAVLGNGTVTDLLTALQESLRALSREYLPPGSGEEDALVPEGALETDLLQALLTSSPRLAKALDQVAALGESIRESRRRAGRVPRSSLAAVAAFMKLWAEAEEPEYVRLVTAAPDPRLQVYCLDPSIATKVLLETAGSIHMSGTLHPLEEYRDSIGLPATAPLRTFPSPFPRENRCARYDPEVTTRFEEVRHDGTTWGRFAERIQAVRAAAGSRNMAVFFPSFEVMQKVERASRIPGLLVEARGARQEELMRLVGGFKGGRGVTLFAVMGGRISEGLDFPADELEVVVIVGLPFAKPTAREKALLRFYDRKFGMGWDYAVRAPMVRKVLQALGRLIRTPTDRGFALLMDKRAASLREFLPDLAPSEDPPGDLARFFDAAPLASQKRL